MKERERELIICIVKNTMKELWKRTGDVLPEEIERSLAVQNDAEQWANLAEQAVTFLETQENNNKKATSVACIFNRLNGNQTSMKWDAVGKTLLEGICYPTDENIAWTEKDFVKIQKGILADLRYFEKKDNYL